MRWLEYIGGLAVARALNVLALSVALVVLLASCSGGSVTGGGPDTTAPKGKTVPPVAFQQITGLPPAKLAQMKTALSVAGGQHDIGFVEGNFQNGTFTIEGDFKISADSAGVHIVYQWRVRDTDGVLAQTIDGEDNAGVFSGVDPWAAVSSAVIDRIAKRTAETLAQKLRQMGYASRLAKLTVPPAEYFAMAGPESQREIDFETVNGPGLASLGMDMVAPKQDPALLAAAKPLPEEEALASQSVAPIPGEAQLAAEIKGPETEDMPALRPDSSERRKVAEAPEAAPPAAAPGAGAAPSRKPQEIRAVAVMPVRGSPGSGDAELTAALRKTLIDAGWPVVTRPQPDALTITGRVQVAAKGTDNQAVSVRWVVTSPDGKTLGDVKQANNVPRGSLDKGWGPAAFLVAEAAASGLSDIVQRFR